MKFVKALLFATLGTLGISCTTSKVTTSEVDKSERNVASDASCEISSSLTGEEKQAQFFEYHKKSIGEVLQESKLTANAQNNVDGITSGLSTTNLDYIRNGFYPEHRLKYATAAMAATTKFLAPSVTENFGFRSLRPTFNRECELFQEKETKKVHALGALASGRMIIYPKLKKLGPNDKIAGEVESPFSGLLQYQGNEAGIPLLLRLSAANPIGHTIEVGGKSLLLEFIPGLGLKFLIDGKRSVDLVAMESLAGQGKDQNFFKYEFSPDFSKHAPSDFNAATGLEQKQMLERYNKNLVNHHVMNLVGQRFFQVIPDITGVPLDQIKAHSNEGPHPFVISIQNLAQIDSKGNSIAANAQKRPWRLVFKPALDNVLAARKAQVVSSDAYVPGKVETDFRYKLGHLKANDRLYYVIAETEDKKRYALGEVVLTSAVSPSPFADNLYFVQHQLDLRKTTFASSIATP